MKLRALNLILFALVALLVASCGGNGRANASGNNANEGQIVKMEEVPEPSAKDKVRAYQFSVTIMPNVTEARIEELLVSYDLWVISRNEIPSQDILFLDLAMEKHPAHGQSPDRLSGVGAVEDKSQIVSGDSTVVNQMLSVIKSFLNEPEIANVGFTGIGGPDKTPNDIFYTDQNWLNTSDEDPLKAEAAWGFITGSPGITIAVIDSGISFTHPDLASRINETESDDFVIEGPDPDEGGDADCSGHGTASAGMAAATGNNSEGVAGIDWNSEIVSMRIVDDDCGWSEKNSRAALSEVANRNAPGSDPSKEIDVVNMSYGGWPENGPEMQAATAAYNSGALLIASAGNSGVDIDSSPHYPASYGVVAASAATDPSKHRAVWDDCSGGVSSNYGENVEYAGQGQSPLTTWWFPETSSNGFGGFCGTSAAAPSVAGVATLGWSLAPEMENTEVREVLYDTGVNVDDKNPGFAGQLGRHVNARNFVRTMHFELNDDHPVENDENPEPLTLGEFHKSGAAYPSDQTDWYEFDGVNEGDDLLFTLNWEDSASDVDLLLYGPDRHLVKEGHSTGPAQMQVDFPDYHNQVAYIKVESFSEGASLYELKGEVTG